MVMCGRRTANLSLSAGCQRPVTRPDKVRAEIRRGHSAGSPETSRWPGRPRRPTAFTTPGRGHSQRLRAPFRAQCPESQ